MPLYRCRYLDNTGSLVQVGVAAEDDAEAINMARSMSANSGARWFDLFEGERFVRIGEERAQSNLTRSPVSIAGTVRRPLSGT